LGKHDERYRTFQRKLFQEMKARIKEKDESVPVFKNGYYYYPYRNRKTIF
jgi:protease II